MSEQGGERDAWLMQRGESLKAYSAFELYQQLGAARSLERVRQLIGKGSVPGFSSASLRYIEQWSSKWAWVERARAWDAHQSELRSQARERKVIEAEERIKDLSPEAVELLFEIGADTSENGAARVAALKDLLDRAKVGKRPAESLLVATGDMADVIAGILGAGALTVKPGDEDGDDQEG